MPHQLLTPNQLRIDLTIAKEVEDNGIGMGVFSDGMPYLTGRGLAKLCGVDQKAIVQVTSALASGTVGPREGKIAALLDKHGISSTQPYVLVDTGSVRYNAFPAPACMAFLEYYSFEAGANIKEEARDNFRLLAAKGIRDYILDRIGYNPQEIAETYWRQYRDRVAASVGVVPTGYFIVFREIADLFVGLLSKGAEIGIHFVPDISVGSTWASHWRNNKLESRYGDRVKTLYSYPDYFPQAAANPHEIHAYPEPAIPEFRQWSRSVYVPSKLPN